MGKKCHINLCKASCCYNVPFKRGFIKAHEGAIINPIKAFQELHGGLELPITDVGQKNKCPFLRSDCRCNIYHDRPDVCKLMATIPQMPCKHYR